MLSQIPQRLPSVNTEFIYNDIQQVSFHLPPPSADAFLHSLSYWYKNKCHFRGQMTEIWAHLATLLLSWLMWRSDMSHCICNWIYLEWISEQSSSILDLGLTHQLESAICERTQSFVAALDALAKLFLLNRLHLCI